MRKRSRSLALLAGSATVALGLAAVPAASASASGIRHGGVLIYDSSWTTIPDEFNPLNPAGTGATAGGTGSLLYEPLIYNNVYTGKQTDLLATGYKWSNGNKTLTITTRKGVDWSDGTPFSATDVAFTFNLLKKFPALDANGDWKTSLSSVTASGPGSVVFQFKSPDTSILPFLLEQEIVPEHLWSKVANPVTYTNPSPVGTGPFLLKSYGDTEVSYVKNPHYWMPGKPYLSGVEMLAVKSNATAQLLLMKGGADFTNDEITDPQRSYVSGHPSDKYWWPVTGFNFLYMNTAVAPFNDVYFRKAVAMTINDDVVAERAYFGAIPPANGLLATGVTSGQVKAWVPSSLKSMVPKYDPSGALKLLESHGYKLVSGSLEAPGGKMLPTFNILVGSGWTDFISIAQTIGQELQPLGIHTTVDQQPYSTYASTADYGRYTMMISWGNGNNITPYYEYYYMFSPGFSAPVGKIATTNWERFTSPTISSSLTSYTGTTNLAAQKSAMVNIEKQVLKEDPVVALTGRPGSFLDYSTSKFTGWPSASNPYNEADPGDGFGGGGEMTYLNVHLK